LGYGVPGGRACGWAWRNDDVPKAI